MTLSIEEVFIHRVVRDCTERYLRRYRGSLLRLLLISNIAATKTITVVDGLPQFLGERIFTDSGASVPLDLHRWRRNRRGVWPPPGQAGDLGRLCAGSPRLSYLPRSRCGTTRPWIWEPGSVSSGAGIRAPDRLASLSGYLVGQFLNAYVVVKIEERTKERHLWARLIGSTVVGEFAYDTALFCFIAFVGVFPTWGALIKRVAELFPSPWWK